MAEDAPLGNARDRPRTWLAGQKKSGLHWSRSVFRRSSAAGQGRPPAAPVNMATLLANPFVVQPQPVGVQALRDRGCAAAGSG
jgi:hypothetical protein